MRNIGYLMMKMRAEEIQSEKHWLFIDIGYPTTKMREGEIPSKDIHIHIQSVFHPS